MTNQCPIFNDQLERVAVNTKWFLKELEQQEILGCFIHIQVTLNEFDFSLTNENVFNITPFISIMCLTSYLSFQVFMTI